MATLRGQVSTAQAVAGGCLSFQHSPGERQSPPALLGGAGAGPCLAASCKKRAALREQPRSSKGHRRAARRHQQPERGRAGSLWPPGLCAPRGRFPASAASEDVPSFLVAAQPSPLPEWHRGTLPASLPPCLPPALPPAQAHPTRRTPLAPRHSQRRVKGRHSHLCLALHQPLQAPGAECPPLGKREGMEEGEQRCLCCSAAGAVLGQRAQTRETLTAWRRLISFSRSLSDGRRVTRALLAPSGVLGSGKGRGERWVSPSCLFSLVRQLCPRAARRRGGPCPQLGSCVALSGCAWSIPPALPQQCAQPQLLQRPRAAERAEKQREAPLPPSPWAEAGTCRALPRGEGHGGRRKPRGAGQRRCPSPGSRSPARAAAFALAFWGPKGHQGMQDVQMPPPSLPAGVLPAPCPGSAPRAEAVPSTAAWPRLGTSRALPWDVAPRLTRRWQHRSRWAR